MANINFTCTLHAWHEGTTLKAYMEYKRTDGQTYFYQDETLPTPTMNLSGVVYQDTAFADAVHNGANIGTFTSTTYSRVVSTSGTKTIIWDCGAGTRTDFQGTWSTTVEIPASPSGLALSTLSSTENSITGTVSISDWGGFGDATTRYLELSLCEAQATTSRYFSSVYGDSLSATITVDANASGHTGSISGVSPNTTYYATMYANNGTAGTGNTSYTAITTLASAPTISLNSVTDATATIAYSTVADGGALTKIIEYSLDGTTWTTGATVSTGSASSGMFIITGLAAGTTYNVQTRTTTSAGSTTGTTLTVTTAAPVTNAVFYGSVNNQSKKIIKMYGSVPTTTVIGVTGEIRSGWTGNISAFDGEVFWNAVHSSLDSTALSYLRIQCDGTAFWVSAYYTDGTARQVLVAGEVSLAQYGITTSSYTSGTDYIDLTPVAGTQNLSKQIKKLYGSYNGVTKLVYEA